MRSSDCALRWLDLGAELDLAQVARLCRREGGRAVAARFFDEFERVANVLVEHPGIGTPTDDERRCLPLTGFPYSAIYRPSESSIRILVVRHKNRDSEHGEQRR